MSNRGSNLAEGHFVIDEGVNPHTGVGTKFHFQGGEVIAEKYQDLEPVLRYCQRMREKFAGQPWGDGKPVGHIPGLYYDEILRTPGGKAERAKAVKAFFKGRPEFCWFPDYLKD